MDSGVSGRVSKWLAPSGDQIIPLAARRRIRQLAFKGEHCSPMVCQLNASTEEKAAIRERNIAEREGSPYASRCKLLGRA